MGNADLYGTDTVSLLTYFTNQLPQKADLIFKKAENNEIVILIPSIVIGELIYTILKGKEIFGKKIPQTNVNFILEVIFRSPSFKIVDLKLKGWNLLLSSKIPELHDRMIVATCIQEGVKMLVTNDSDILNSKEIEVVW
ncbi:MAG: type II toxin-antitoxin system VapC family toxin [Candidatus Heimdallarchaeota archaeon]|nr:type II toxin-antitoxin system VapC family toxin [Candidatus Heimdallarchaeota archaeon]